METAGGLESLLDASHRRARALLGVLDVGRALVPAEPRQALGTALNGVPMSVVRG